MMDAVCIDGTPPAYHLDPGYGEGKNRWIVDLEGGGWCDSVSACLFRKAGRLGSSNRMDKQMYFAGIMSSSPVDNPGLYPQYESSIIDHSMNQADICTYVCQISTTGTG